MLTPSEIIKLTNDILAELQYNEIISQKINIFQKNWQEAFNKFGHSSKGELTYRYLLLELYERVFFPLQKQNLLTDKAKNTFNIMLSIFDNLTQRANIPPVFSVRKPIETDFYTPEFIQPIFILSAPRSGSTLLFETLSQFKEIWTIGEEGHEILEGIHELHAAHKNYESNRLTEEDANSCQSDLILQRFTRHLRNRELLNYLKIENAPKNIRFLEKNPKNSLRIPFLKAIFPDALFIYLYRDAKETISSLIEGWRSRKFIAYRSIPGWKFREWSFLLPSGWRSLENCSLAEIASYQWQKANECILQDLKNLPESSWCFISYANLIKNPKDTAQKIGKFANLIWDNIIEQRVSKSLPISGKTLSAPFGDKWRKNESELNLILPSLAPLIDAINSFFDSPSK